MIEKLTNIATTADILAEPGNPDVITKKDSQLLYGEIFVVEEEHGAYVYGHSEIDGYKGCVSREDLARKAPEANAVISSLSAHLYPKPDMKTRPEMSVSFMSRINIKAKMTEGFYETHDGLWVYKDHARLIDTLPLKRDLAAIAGQFIGTPYLYGGRSSNGIDCSALVQLSLMALGYNQPPRDSVDQKDVLGTEITKDELQRNDIVFFDGHVGIMADSENFLNATARYMTTLIEPLTNVEKAYDGITKAVRL